ncbi:MAG: hypothetical protein KAJ64_05615 [Thermoplasmata archaeon]|nr:hypothetical protein [Thermoplasmata archaeon]
MAKNTQPVDGQKSEDGSKLCECYQKNPVLKLIYDKLKFIPFPLNIFLVTVSIWLFYLFAFAQYDFLHDAIGSYPGFLTLDSIYHPIFFIIIPALLIIMSDLYKQLDKTFANLKEITKYSPDDYKQKLDDWKALLESNHQFIISGILIVLVIGNTILKNITLGGDPDYPYSFQFYPLIATVNLLFFLLAGFIVGSLIWHLFNTVKIIREFFAKPNKLSLQPFHPDGAAGLQPLTKLTFKMNLICVFAMVIPLWEVLINGRDPLDTTILSYVIVITIVAIAVFFFPLLKAHNVMKESKLGTLKKLSVKHSATYRELMEEIDEEGASFNSTTMEHLKEINELYEVAKKMPIWPFDTNFIIKVATAIGMPIIMYFYDIILSFIGI